MSLRSRAVSRRGRPRPDVQLQLLDLHQEGHAAPGHGPGRFQLLRGKNALKSYTSAPALRGIRSAPLRHAPFLHPALAAGPHQRQCPLPGRHRRAQPEPTRFLTAATGRMRSAAGSRSAARRCRRMRMAPRRCRRSSTVPRNRGLSGRWGARRIQPARSSLGLRVNERAAAFRSGRRSAVRKIMIAPLERRAPSANAHRRRREEAQAMVKTVLYAEKLYDNDKIEREVFGPDVGFDAQGPPCLPRGPLCSRRSDGHRFARAVSRKPARAVISPASAASSRAFPDHWRWRSEILPTLAPRAHHLRLDSCEA